eukprot:987185-Prymnesium_polylepis.1
MVSALESRSPARAHHLAASPHHQLSPARFSVLTPAKAYSHSTFLPGSTCVRACHRRLGEAAEPSARARAA